jgi:ArsR family transcriptional regulator
MEFVRALKALADPLRLRVLAAISKEELTVGEVQEVVASVQSSVSRNLAILRAAGFVQDRKEGTNVYFSVREDMPEPARELFKSMEARLEELPEAKRDKARIEECRHRRLQRSQSYFESVAGDWERIRKSYFDDRVASLAIEKLLPRNLVLADIGCGTGSLTFELARFAKKVVGVDLSPEMLRRLHFLADPKLAVAELCRITRAGGSIIIVDLVQHSQQWMREQMAHRWLGFEQAAVESWFEEIGATEVHYELTGAFAGGKMARNGNRPVEIFVTRAIVPAGRRRQRTKKASR